LREETSCAQLFRTVQPLCLGQIGLALLQLLFGHERFLHPHSGSADQAGHNHCGRQGGDHQHDILRVVDPELKEGRGKEIIQASNGNERKNGRFNEGARQGQQCDEDQVDEGRRRED
jgi:hypothetical protein